MTFRTKHLNRTLQTGAFLLLALGPIVKGATIAPPVSLGNGSGSVSGSVYTPNPDNGHITGLSPNRLSLTETIQAFWFSADFGLPASNGSTEYFVGKEVTNETGKTWTDFQINVGCGQYGGNSSCGFYPLTLDYNVAPTISTPATLSAQSSTSMTWSGLHIVNGQSVVLEFSMYTCPNCEGQWGIFQDATLASGVAAPEPQNAVLISAGLLLIGLSRVRRHRPT